MSVESPGAVTSPQAQERERERLSWLRGRMREMGGAATRILNLEKGGEIDRTEADTANFRKSLLAGAHVARLSACSRAPHLQPEDVQGAAKMQLRVWPGGRNRKYL